MALGGGLSQALGVAGFPNLDVVRNPTLGHAPYIARAQIHQIIPLSSEWVPNEDRGPISSFVEVPKHRLELRFGKMSTADLFDINPAASDSHLQFMNWTVDNNGAYDYAADTRGYTYGLVIEYQGPRIEARLGEMLMPKVANGIDLDFDFTRARADNLELEIKYGLQAGWRGTLRLLVYQNTANMGNYRQAIDAAAATPGVVPDVTLTRAQGRVKRGVGANLIQDIAGVARAFMRLGWSTGDLEAFAYTEVENTVLARRRHHRRLLAAPHRSHRARLREQRHLQRPRRLPGGRRPGLPARRRLLEVRARDHRRALLQRACLARSVVRRGHSVHREPGLQLRPRPGLGLLVARTSGVLIQVFRIGANIAQCSPSPA